MVEGSDTAPDSTGRRQDLTLMTRSRYVVKDTWNSVCTAGVELVSTSRLRDNHELRVSDPNTPAKSGVPARRSVVQLSFNAQT